MPARPPAGVEELTRSATVLYGHIEEQIRFADTKAQLTIATNAVFSGIIVTLNTALVAGLHQHGISILPGTPNAALILGVAMFSALVLAALAGSFTFALLAVKPYRRLDDDSWMYFGKIAQQANKTLFIESFLGLSPDEIVRATLEEDFETARIAASKFARVGWSIRCLIAAIILFFSGIFVWLLILAVHG